MYALKKIFPSSFKVVNLKTLVTSIIVYLVTAFVVALIMSLTNLFTGWIPVIGSFIGLFIKMLGSILKIYVTVAILLSILKFFGIAE